MSIDTIAVIGAGTMGRGIAESAAVHGLTVSIAESDAAQRETALSHITASIEKGIKRGKLPFDDPRVALDRICWESDIGAAAAGAEFVIEAVPEQEAIKADVLKQAESVISDDVILASNTSSISITRLAALTSRPDRVVGMHFFNPVPVMEPVEIVRGSETSDETIERISQLAIQMGKQPFTVADKPGFVVNRVLMPLINEAAFALEDGVADARTIDSLVKLGCRHPMGPLELADLVGLDVCLSILGVLHRDLGDEKFRPCPLLAQMVDDGHLGRKSGQGFYNY